MSGYSTEPKPLGGYAALMGAFGAAVAGAACAGRRLGVRLPERYGLGDVFLASLATQKLSRLIAKDRVTSPLRAPFVRFEGDDGQGEVTESARGEGLRRATGELVSCPYCLGLWVAAAFAGGLVAAPRETRLVAAVFAIHGLADAFQLAYATGRERL